ncbi:unnamed protein product [Orchesella dallaii]|uniref:Uncharacterized protein n=1 Tax=Orchesella dallaii TaxID=48710 RepID=A0ABP1REZ0_9HEXA
MDPNRPRKDPRTTKTKTKAKTTHRVEARSIFSSQPLPGANVGLSQPGFGIISNLNDTMRRHQGEASSSSSSSNATIRISGMNHILGVAQQESHANCNPTPPSSEPQTSPSLVSLNNDIIYENSPSSYQVASMSIPNPSMNPVPVAADVRNHADLSLNPYVQVGESGASETFRDYIDFGDGSGSDLTNYGISLDGQNMGLNSGMDDYSRHYVPNMNESGTEHLQPVPISSEQYDSQQENWYHPERNPASAFQMLERFANPNPPFHIRQPGESIISQGTQGQHLHPLYPPNTLAPPTATIVAPEAQEQDLILLPGIPGQAQTYEDPGASYATNDDPRQYLLLNQGGSQPQSQIQHADYLSMTNESTEQQNQHMISDEDVLNVCLGNTPAALPPIQLMSTPAALPPSQLMSGNDNTQQQYQPQPTRSVIMHTNSVQHPNHESEIPSEPGSSLSVNDDVKVSPKKKKSVPRKPRKPVEVEKQNETLAELFISVIDKATCNKNQQIENAGLELVRISNVHGVDLVEGNASVRNEGEVSDKQGSLSNDLEGLASRVSLFSELPVNPESVYQGGDLFIMKTCHEGHPLPPSSGAAIVGASSLAQISPGVSESTPLTKKPRKKTEPKPKATTPRKPRVTKAKTKETDSTDKTSQNKGQRSKKVVKKELDQVQMEEVMLSAVGTVLGKDAAKYCEDEQVKVPIKLEETVSDGASATNKLVANLPDLTVSLLTMTEAELAALTTPSKTTAPVTSIKSERSDENSDASSIAENKDNKGKRATSGKSANRNRARRRVSLDVTSESGDDEDYTPRTTRSRSAKVKSVSSSGRSATGVDSDSRSSAGHRWKDSADYGEAEVTSDLDSESGTIKVVGKHGDNSAAQDERTIKRNEIFLRSCKM